MEIQEYKRCANGHLMYDYEIYCVVCGVDDEGNSTRMEFCCSLCRNRKFRHRERYCPNCGVEREINTNLPFDSKE